MNDQQIYELMAVKPQITAVQISGALDESLSEVSTALRALVECGDVVRTAGSAFGAATMLYDLSDAFKASKEYRALRALMAQDAAQDRAQAVPVAVAPPVAPVEQPAETRIDLAIAYLTKHGAVDENELRVAIGLKDGAYPVAYLTRAIKAGTIHKRRDGKWAMGAVEVVAAAKPKAKPVPKAFTATRPKVGPVAQFSATAQPDDVVAIEAPAPGPVAPPAVLRCGLWSDGKVEVQRDGVTVAVMSRAEGEFVSSFLARMSTW